MELQEIYDKVKDKEIIGGKLPDGKTERFFIATNGNLCAFFKGSSRRGFSIGRNLDRYSSFIYKKAEPTADTKLKKAYLEIGKYKRLAATASFTNPFIRSCNTIPDFDTWKADLVTKEFGQAIEPRPKTLYELDITTGNSIDGKVITLDRIYKQYPYVIDRLREAIRTQTTDDYISSRYSKFAGYDMSISTKKADDGDFMGFLSLEFSGCGNGYYYLLINDNNFIGYDVD